jgi:hypothetical protein
MTKEVYHRWCIRKVPRSSLVRSPRVAVVVASSSKGSLSSSSSFGVREAPVVKAPLVRTSTLIPPLWKEDGLAAAPVANLVPPYFPGHVVDREGDFYSFVESSVVHSPNLGQVEPGYLGKDCSVLEFPKVMFLMFRWKIVYAIDDKE